MWFNWGGERSDTVDVFFLVIDYVNPFVSTFDMTLNIAYLVHYKHIHCASFSCLFSSHNLVNEKKFLLVYFPQ